MKKVFNVNYKNFNGKNEVVTGVGIEYFTKENGFNDNDIAAAGRATLTSTWTRGAGVTERMVFVQPKNTLQIVRTA